MEFKFDTQYLTMFDDRVSAFFDKTTGRKAIAKKDMLRLDEADMSLIVSDEESITALYTLAEQWIPMVGVSVSFTMDIDHIGQMDLLTLNHGGYVRLSHEKVQVHFVTENGEFDFDITTDYCSGKATEFTIQCDGDSVDIRFSIYHSNFELPANCRNGLEIAGFFGEISDTSAKVHRITVKPCSENVFLTSGKKAVEHLDRLSEPKEEGPLTGVEQMTQEINKEILLRVLSMEQAYIQRITGLKLEDLRSMDRKTLVRTVYNSIAEDTRGPWTPRSPIGEKPNQPRRSHLEILKEAHYTVACFLDGDTPMETPVVGVGDGIYNTFEFGEINKANCSPDKLLYLVKTYPDIWIKRLI